MTRGILGSTFYFIERPDEVSAVLSWFRSLSSPPEEVKSVRGITLYFRHLGPLLAKEDGSIDVRRSPLVSLVPPRTTRGVLTTVGEVHFLVGPIGSIPGYDAIVSAFRRWINKQDRVFEQAPKPPHGFEYYLEGSIQNIAPVVYGFPSGIEDLQRERYFIADDDAQGDLLSLCQRLRLRGVECC